mmetsp:Transcript_131541/g.366605  ORF Transcript_131541/g.366605 Transcript_131541/m.366605 type:complete len:289 (+) Transcript_131541:159-1025(+)
MSASEASLSSACSSVRSTSGAGAAPESPCASTNAEASPVAMACLLGMALPVAVDESAAASGSLSSSHMKGSAGSWRLPSPSLMASPSPKRLSGPPTAMVPSCWTRAALNSVSGLAGRVSSSAMSWPVPPLGSPSSAAARRPSRFVARQRALPMTSSRPWVSPTPLQATPGCVGAGPSSSAFNSKLLAALPASGAACCVAPMMSSSSAGMLSEVGLFAERCTPRSDAKRPAAPRGVLGSGKGGGASPSEHSSTGSSVPLSIPSSSWQPKGGLASIPQHRVIKGWRTMLS